MSDAAAEVTPPDAELPAPWRAAESLVLAAGWALAAASLGPAALAGGDGSAAMALAAALAFWPLAVWVARTDLRSFVIPDEASAAIAALGLLAAAGETWLGGEGGGGAAQAALDAAAIGAGAFALFWTVGAACRRLGRDALGFGDVKLAGACALWLSPADAASALEVAVLAAAAALLLRRGEGRLRDTAIPFGAFLAPAAWLVLVLAPPLRDAGWMPW